MPTPTLPDLDQLLAELQPFKALQTYITPDDLRPLLELTPEPEKPYAIGVRDLIWTAASPDHPGRFYWHNALRVIDTALTRLNLTRGQPGTGKLRERLLKQPVSRVLDLLAELEVGAYLVSEGIPVEYETKPAGNGKSIDWKAEIDGRPCYIEVTAIDDADQSGSLEMAGEERQLGIDRATQRIAVSQGVIRDYDRVLGKVLAQWQEQLEPLLPYLPDEAPLVVALPAAGSAVLVDALDWGGLFAIADRMRAAWWETYPAISAILVYHVNYSDPFQPSDPHITSAQLLYNPMPEALMLTEKEEKVLRDFRVVVD